MKLTPRWICPRCHIPLQFGLSLCRPCDQFGNFTARFEDGSIGKATAAANGQPVRRPA
jgi:hypothetical protein